MQFRLLVAIFLFSAFRLSAQISFSNQTRLLSPFEHFSGVDMAVVDMNGDGLDDIVRLDQSYRLNIQYQTAPGRPFIATPYLNLPQVNNTWGICAADFNNDGINDLVTGGIYNGIKFLSFKKNGTFTIQNVTQPDAFVQSVNFADIDTDGWLDAFVCHDDAAARIFRNNGAGTFSYQPSMIDLKTVPASDNSGNYGSVWSDIDNDGDLDLYIAKCRQVVTDPTDPRRINQLFLNNGDNTFTQDVTNEHGLRIGAQSWTADFGDIDNDGDFDCFITNHDASNQLMENDGTGHFSDITESAGLTVVPGDFPIQGLFRDFDNDGLVDILVAGGKHTLYHNNGDKTFSAIQDPFGSTQIESVALGDLNNDGFQDIYAGYAIIFNQPSCFPDVLWINNGNDNHYFGLKLIGKQSNRSGVGAKARVFSALGMQTREVRSGEGYGISNSLNLHFGLRQDAKIDSVTIDWSSGLHQTIIDPAIDQYLTVHEGECSISTTALIADGPLTFCTGGQVGLSTPASYQTYQWSNGSTDAQILAQTKGKYDVTLTDADGCTVVSKPIWVEVDSVETPVIQSSAGTIICRGSSTTLSCSSAAMYTWNNGLHTQSIEVTEPGAYWVETKGLCQNWTSQSFQVNVIESPAPAVAPDTVQVGQQATLIAVGDHITWYGSPNMNDVLVENDTFLTPALSHDTTFWASDKAIYEFPKQKVGPPNQGSFGETNYNGGLYFNAEKPFVLRSVSVYTTSPGQRKIQVFKKDGSLLDSRIINIPNGISRIILDFDIPVGEEYLLTTDKLFNQTQLGTSGPKLRRNDTGITFPYRISGTMSITHSTQGCDTYYYFFDWEITFSPIACESERVPVKAVVKASSGLHEGTVEAMLKLFPNPTTGSFNIKGINGAAQVVIQNSCGQTLKTLSIESGSEASRISVADFPSGLYWVTVSTAKGSARLKLLVR